ncbi:MAG: FeoB-associated Cys-rich membrane protein [Lachnospiraceae bacterium]|nr:FeoB-associated Cys-rich membrane protein [Lachnospiraceae bacterium]
MLAWLMENMATIIISAVLVLLVATVIASMVHSKRKGKSSCGCGCGGCPAGSLCAMNGACHRPKPETLRE